MTDPQMDPVPSPPPGPPPASRSKAPIWLIVLIVTVGCVVVAVVALVFLRDDTKDAVSTAAPVAPVGAPNPVQLEPISSATDPFAPPAGTDTPVKAVQVSAPATVEGGKVGLYGGTMDYKQCDKQQLSTFLQQNPDKGAAWATILGITPDQIPTYVADLTPVILRSDTAVTNHGFKGGQATTVQSVLQAGTAVLVDSYGQPVTKCYCGNPLQPPTFTSVTPPTPQNPTTTQPGVTTTTTPTYYGPEWPEWTPTSITIINVNVTVIEVYILVDSETGKTFERPRGTDGSQDKLVGEAAPTPENPTVTTTTGKSPSPSPATTTTTYPTTTTWQTTTTWRDTTTTEPYYPEDCVDEYGNFAPCPGG